MSIGTTSSLLPESSIGSENGGSVVVVVAVVVVVVVLVVGWADVVVAAVPADVGVALSSVVLGAFVQRFALSQRPASHHLRR